LDSRTLLAVVPPVPDFRVNSTIEGTQWKPAIAADANGDFVVAWAGGGGQDGDGYGIYAQRYNPAGQPQGTEFLINTTTQRSQMNPSVAIDGAGIVRRNLLQSLPAAEPTLVERSAALAELPEMAGWFLDPEAVQADAVELLAARESRLVVSDTIKAERRETIVGGVIAREFTSEARSRWARRLVEMALVFDATERPELGGLARAAAAHLADRDTDPRRHPFARALAERALDLAAEVVAGRLKAADVSRKVRSVE